MATFKLGSGQNAFDLDALGTVLQNGVLVGAWNTTPDNKVFLRRHNGDSIAFDVGWKFNPDNQLVVLSQGQEIFNFHKDPNARPVFGTRNAVLRITPNKRNPFTFELRGEWDLKENHDLSITINGQKSIITGFISDPEGKFIFFFADKSKPLLKHKLGFVGSWEVSKQREGSLDFKFRREDGSTDTFQLPGSITINRITNQLRYEYRKNGTQALDFVGTLIISPDFQISYSLNRQVSNAGEIMVGATTLSFGAVYRKNDLSGDLELTLKKPDGTIGETTLAIRGSFTAVRGDSNLQVGFIFEQIRAGQKITTTFGFAGKLEFRNGNVQWAFTTSHGQARTINLGMGSQVKLGATHLDANLNLEVANGQFQGVTFLLGVNF